MATIKLAGDVYVVESAYGKKALEKVQKYRPELLTLVDEKKNPVFAVSVGNSASLNKYGIEFNAETPTDIPVACATFPIPCGGGNAKDRVVEAVGPAILNLKYVEDQIDDALAEIDEELAAIANCVEVI